MILYKSRLLSKKLLNQEMIKSKIIVIVSSIACLAACTGDFLTLFLFGPRFPGYSQLHDTMSKLGSSASPVSDLISNWWIMLGILFVVFAVGFRIAYRPADKYLKIAFWLIVLYGLGEGLGSGLFKADRLSGSLTTSFIIHDIVGGLGILGLLLLPLIVPKIKPHFSSKNFVGFSLVTFFLVLVFLVLFSFRFIGDGNNCIAIYKGLWQRLFVLISYIYMSSIAFKMIRKAKTFYSII
jgi:hypothetical protein